MPAKLNAIVVDDDEFIVNMLKDMCRDSAHVNIIGAYSDPQKFFEDSTILDFDLVLLDISMPTLDGTVLAKMLDNKPIIFVTGVESRLRDALNLSPIDVIVKPFTMERLNKALEKACMLIDKQNEYELFNVAESNGKIKLKMTDIFLIHADEMDARNKRAILRDGSKYTLMDYTMEALLKICPTLVQVNKGQLISVEAFSEIDKDVIILKGLPAEYKSYAEVTLSRAYKPQFMKKVFRHK